jgi:Tfp pilus assembly protein PilF
MIPARWSDQARSSNRAPQDLITAIFPDNPQDHRAWPACASAAPHVEAVTGHAASSPSLAAEVASLLNNLGIYLWRSAQLAGARATLHRALAIAHAAYGPDHPNVAVVQRELGTQ